jgi:hypothetical protein
MENNTEKQTLWNNTIIFLDSCKILRKNKIQHFNTTLSIINHFFPTLPQNLKNRLTSLYNDYAFNHNDKETIINEMLYYAENNIN